MWQLHATVIFRLRWSISVLDVKKLYHYVSRKGTVFKVNNILCRGECLVAIYYSNGHRRRLGRECLFPTKFLRTWFSYVNVYLYDSNYNRCFCYSNTSQIILLFWNPFHWADEICESFSFCICAFFVFVFVFFLVDFVGNFS